MQLTLDHVTQLAPDEKAVASARQLLSLHFWSDLGMNESALWGDCRGAGIYRVRIDLSNLGQSCNCPSRKRPCRHSLGLLMLLVTKPDAIEVAEPPPDVAEWLEKRKQRDAKSASRKIEKKPVDDVARGKRVERREGRVTEGIESLQRWICDLVRTGVAGIEVHGPEFWETQARRMVDAQAPGLAQRLRRLGEMPGESVDWPERLLKELGRLELLLIAAQRLSELSPDLQADVRQFLGWTLSQSDLEDHGDRVNDQWIVVGQREEDDDRLRSKWIWLQSLTTGTFALILQFAPGTQPFALNWPVGTRFTATMLFYPGTRRERARLVEQSAISGANASRLPSQLIGLETVEALLQSHAEALARSPWIPTTLAVLKNVTITPQSGQWWVRDRQGQGIPCRTAQPWKLLASSGGQAVHLFGEWDGEAFRPLTLMTDGQLMDLT